MKPTCRWRTAVQDALYRAEQAMDDLLQNFPNRVVAGLFHRDDLPDWPSIFGAVWISWITPWRRSRRCRTPHRSRIGRGQYLTPAEHNCRFTGRSGCDVIAADPIHQRICKELRKICRLLV